MFGWLLRFLVAVAFNGFIALIATVVLWALLAIALAFATIPIGIIGGTRAAESFGHFFDGDWPMQVIYIVVFASLMLDSLGIPHRKWLWGKCESEKKDQG